MTTTNAPERRYSSGAVLGAVLAAPLALVAFTVLAIVYALGRLLLAALLAL